MAGDTLATLCTEVLLLFVIPNGRLAYARRLLCHRSGLRLALPVSLELLTTSGSESSQRGSVYVNKR